MENRRESNKKAMSALQLRRYIGLEWQEYIWVCFRGHRRRDFLMNGCEMLRGRKERTHPCTMPRFLFQQLYPSMVVSFIEKRKSWGGVGLGWESTVLFQSLELEWAIRQVKSRGQVDVPIWRHTLGRY